jgi:elongation factor Ts
MKNNIKISAAEVKELREKTGASVMECRNALLEGEGDFKKALEHLRKSGNEKALKKSQRATSEGIIAAYIHSNQKIGAMVELLCESDFVAMNKEFQELAHDLAMHIAAMNPKYESLEKVPEKDMKEYESIARKEAASEKKPPEIMEKIVAGKVKKYFSTLSLMSQSFVKIPEITVENLVKEKISKIGENIQLGSFVRFSL